MSHVRTALDELMETALDQCSHRELDRLEGATQLLRSFIGSCDTKISRRRSELWANGIGWGGGGGGTGADDGGSAGADGSGGGGSGGTGGAGDGPGGDGPGGQSSFGGIHDRRSGKEAERARTRAGVGDAMPAFEAALERGEIDVEHLDAIAAAQRDLDDDVRAEFVAHETMLLGYARVERPERFRRRCRDLARRINRDHGVRLLERQKKQASVRRWVDQATGMTHIHHILDPESAARFDAAFSAHVQTLRARSDTADMTLQRIEVEAFIELVTASTRLEPRSAEVSVLIDWATLNTGVFGPDSVAETSCGHALPPATIRRMACDATIIPIVLGADGVPLDMGREQRLANRNQRRALRAMFRTCAHPGCQVTFDRCRIHHIVPWELFGLTHLVNLIPLCERHHHMVHEGGWILTMTPDWVTTWRTPDGTVWFVGDTRDRAASSWTPPAESARVGAGTGAGAETHQVVGSGTGAGAGAATQQGAGAGAGAAARAGGGTPTRAGAEAEARARGSRPVVDGSRVAEAIASMNEPPGSALAASAAAHDANDHADADPDARAESGVAGRAVRSRERHRSHRCEPEPSLFAHDITRAGP
jgi:hypothetical protein